MQYPWARGLFLGAVWGIVQGALSGLWSPRNYWIIGAEVVLDAVLWCVVALVLSLLLKPTPFKSPRSQTWILSAIFLATYVNFALIVFVLKGVSFLSSSGWRMAVGVTIVLSVLPLVVARNKPRRIDQIHISWSFLATLALLTGLLFAGSREWIRDLSTNTERILVTLASALIIQALLVVIFAFNKAPLWRKTLRWIVPLGLLILFLTSEILLSPGAMRASAPPRFPPVILISLDTTRPDHLSYFDYPRETSPHIDAFLKESRVYPRAHSTSSWTLPSHASVYTGLFPKAHGAHHVEGATIRDLPLPMDSQVPTLGESMRDRGYLTAAIVSNLVSISINRGLSRGFDYIDAKYFPSRYPIPPTFIYSLRGWDHPLVIKWTDDLRRADTMTDLVQTWIEPRKDQPFFLLLNYFDPHTAFSPPQPFSALGEPFSFNAWYHRVPDKDLSWEERIDLYDGEIVFMDKHVGRLFEYLKEADIYDRALIILFSDHGEFLGERGGLRMHGKNLDEVVSQVVYGVRYPKGLYAGIDSSFVNLADVWSFVDAYLDEGKVPDLDSPQGPRVTGEKYLKELETQKHGFGGTRLVSVYWRDYKYVSYGLRGRLYDLLNDPSELNDLSGELEEASSFLHQLIQEWDAGLSVPEFIEDPQAAERAREVLKSLGYIQ